MTMRSYSLRRRVAHEDGLLQAAAALPLTYVGRQHRRRLQRVAELLGATREVV